tara:strand:+ start:780 stop:1439 length:660 start_codon:yes stop_codon:yes gene_type:complete
MASVSKNRSRAVILARVSTKMQETNRQVNELKEIAESKDWNVIKIFRETVSGAVGKPVGWEIAVERKALEDVLELAKKKKIDKVLVHEISRIARRNSDVHRFIEKLTDYGVSLYWHQQRMETLDDRGKRDSAASIMLAIWAEMARSEREVLRERVISGIAEAKKRGVKFGRPKGKETSKAFIKKHRDIVKLLEANNTMRYIRDHTGKSMGTIQKVRDLL